jgi:hypothetical protein
MVDALAEGGVMVHTRSEGRGWFKQISSVAAETDFKLQF